MERSYPEDVTQLGSGTFALQSTGGVQLSSVRRGLAVDLEMLRHACTFSQLLAEMDLQLGKGR